MSHNSGHVIEVELFTRELKSTLTHLPVTSIAQRVGETDNHEPDKAISLYMV